MGYRTVVVLVNINIGITKLIIIKYIEGGLLNDEFFLNIEL